MSNIKKCFVSRFGTDGVIVEADYSQIEVVVQAFLSGDKQMRKDIFDGIDFHCKRLAFKLGETYEDIVRRAKHEKLPEYVKLRKNIKTFSFRKAYGGGPKSVSLELGISLAESKEFFAIEEALYPGIKVMQDEWITEVEASKKASTATTPLGFQACRGFITSVTGKRYVFTESDVPKEFQKSWKDGIPFIKRVGFAPTQIKNYPVQGLAGELMYMAIGKLVRALLNSESLRDKCILINTVHDSIIFDIHKSVLPEALKLIKKIMIGVPEWFNEQFNINFDLPLSVGISFGPTWLEQEEVEV